MCKIKVLSEFEIKKLINMKMVIEAVEKAFVQKSSSRGSVWPMVFYEYEHNVFDLDIRSGNLDDSNVYGLKVISYNENNVNKNLPKVCATSLIFDSKTGIPLALLNAAPITSYRTGAAAAIGAKYLARKEAENLLVVGCGNVSVHSIAAMLITMPNIKNVYVCNPKNPSSVFERIDKFKSEVNRLVKEADCRSDAMIIGSDNLEEMVKKSDIIVTATPAEKAMIKAEWVQEGTHFSCMGGGLEGKQEIDEKIFERALIYADDKESCLKYGEAQTAFRDNIIIGFDGEIGEVIVDNKLGRKSDSDITIFDSTGLFVQDLAAAIELLNKSNEVGIGIEIEV